MSKKKPSGNLTCWLWLINSFYSRKMLHWKEEPSRDCLGSVNCKTQCAIWGCLSYSSFKKYIVRKTDVILRRYRFSCTIFMYSTSLLDSLSFACDLNLPFIYFTFQLKSFHEIEGRICRENGRNRIGLLSVMHFISR